MKMEGQSKKHRAFEESTVLKKKSAKNEVRHALTSFLLPYIFISLRGLLETPLINKTISFHSIKENW